MKTFCEKIRDILTEEGRPLSLRELKVKWDYKFPENKKTDTAWTTQVSHSVNSRRLGKIKFLGLSSFYTLPIWMSNRNPNELREGYKFNPFTLEFKTQ